MTAKLRLGGWVLFFVLSGLSANLTQVQPGLDLEKLAKASQPAPLTQEQKALVDHLSSKYSKPPALVERIVRAAYKEATRYELSPLLVLAIIEKESSLNPHSVNTYGAQGLMQVVPRFHADKLTKVKNPDGLLNPETNIRVGTQILAEYVNGKRGNLQHALKKYSGNARNYFKKVVAFRKDLEKVKQTSLA